MCVSKVFLYAITTMYVVSIQLSLNGRFLAQVAADLKHMSRLYQRPQQYVVLDHVPKAKKLLSNSRSSTQSGLWIGTGKHSPDETHVCYLARNTELISRY